MLQNWKEVIKMMLGAHPEIDDEARERKQKIMNKVFGGAQDIDGAIMHLDARKERMEKSILLNLRKKYKWLLQCFPGYPSQYKIHLHTCLSIIRLESRRFREIKALWNQSFGW